MSRRHKENEVKTTDSFSNEFYRLGFGSQSPLEATKYPLTRMTDDFTTLTSLYRSNWIVQNIVNTIPDDIVKKWYTLSGDISPEAIDQYVRMERRVNLKDTIKTGLYWGRLYGGAVGLMLIDGQDDLTQPLDIDAIMPGDFKGLYIVDRWTGVNPSGEIVTDWSDPDFGLPRYYDIMDVSGGVVARVHHSRVIRFVGRELPYTERVANLYWGESEIESVYEEAVKRDNVSHNMAALTFRACRDYMEVDNLDQLFTMAPAAQQRRFWDMLQAQSVCDSNFGIRLVNKGDTMHNTQYHFEGLASVYEAVMMDISGASHIPITKLFGRSPAGMNATGESDMQNYYDYVDSVRDSQLRPILDRLLPVIAASTWGEMPNDIDIEFAPLWTPRAAEIAEIASKKSKIIIEAFQAGLIDQGTALEEMKGLTKETGLFDKISDEAVAAAQGRSFQDVTQLRDPLMGLDFSPSMEGGDASPFEQNTTDALTVDWKGQPRNRGKFSFGKMNGKSANKLKNFPFRDKMSKREEKAVSKEILTWHPNYKSGEVHSHRWRGIYYRFDVIEPGKYHFGVRFPIVGFEALAEEFDRKYGK